MKPFTAKQRVHHFDITGTEQYSGGGMRPAKKPGAAWSFPFGTSLSVIVLLSLSAISYAGENAKELIGKIRANYEQMTACEANMRYTIYRGFDSDKITEEYMGYFCRQGENSFRKIHNADYINLSDQGMYVVADHATRTLTLSNSIVEKPFETDLESALKFCGNVVSTENDDHILFALYLNKPHDMPYCRFDLRVDKNYFIQSITLYYAAKMNFSNDFFNPDMDHAKMTIAYEDFKTKWNDESGRLDVDTYLQKKNDSYEASALYKNYTVVDMRR